MTTQWTSTPPATPGLYFAARDRTPGFVRHWGGSAWSMPLDVRDVDWGQLHHTSFARDGVQERIEWVGRQLTYTNDGWILWGGQPCPLANRTLVVAECGNGNTHGGAASSVNWGDVVRFKVMSDGIEKPGTPAAPLGIGDVSGTTKGSAARFNTGKPDLALVPLRDCHSAYSRMGGWDDAQQQALDCLGHLAVFQETGECVHLHAAMVAIGSPWDECARVLEYGKRKYSEWNWARGQKWSVCVASGARHIMFGILKGETHDAESTETHRGHVMANLCFLSTFTRVYPEGNDLPVQWLKVAA